MINSKVILLIVEGKLDRYFYREYLGSFISSCFSNGEIKYKVTSGDVLTQNNPNGIKDSIEVQLKSALDEHKLDAEDIIYIAHLCDTDGSYLEESDFMVDQMDSLDYGQNYKYALSNSKIYTKDAETRERLIASWRRKKSNQSVLINCNEVMGVPYRLYYNSMFLEHFLTGRIPRYSEDKRDCINYFFDEYSSFDQLVNYSDSKKISDDYMESWELLKLPENKMISATNLNIFFNDVRFLSN